MRQAHSNAAAIVRIDASGPPVLLTRIEAVKNGNPRPSDDSRSRSSRRQGRIYRGQESSREQQEAALTLSSYENPSCRSSRDPLRTSPAHSNRSFAPFRVGARFDCFLRYSRSSSVALSPSDALVALPAPHQFATACPAQLDSTPVRISKDDGAGWWEMPDLRDADEEPVRGVWKGWDRPLLLLAGMPEDGASLDRVSAACIAHQRRFSSGSATDCSADVTPSRRSFPSSSQTNRVSSDQRCTRRSWEETTVPPTSTMNTSCTGTPAQKPRCAAGHCLSSSRSPR